MRVPGRHFLESAAARTLDQASINAMSDEEVAATWERIRFSANGGAPFCPTCKSDEVRRYRCRPIFKCADCKRQFSLTSGTLFDNHKLKLRQILYAIALFVQGAKGLSALQLSRHLNVDTKTAFVLLHKVREALGAIPHNGPLEGEVEIDGAAFKGKVRPYNRKPKTAAEKVVQKRREDGARAKQIIVVSAVERGGERRVRSTVVRAHESNANPYLYDAVSKQAVVFTDEGGGWTSFPSHFEDALTINHSQGYWTEEAHTNNVEAHFSRLRRSQYGIHHKMSEQHLQQYATEMAWRETFKRRSNGAQFDMVTHAALGHGLSKHWRGYWKKKPKKAAA